MADPVSYERDIEQALITLKKGTQLLKYSRKGKPKFCPFRISTDETTLIWYSSGRERNLKLSSVSRIVPGQRTAVFKRYLRPEKEYLSFSLLYNNGDRSLDVICKDKVEAEVWLAGLKALISPGQSRSRRTQSDISDIQGGGSDFLLLGRSFGGATLDPTSSFARTSISSDSSFGVPSLNFSGSDVGSERANMQARNSIGDGFRISVSSTPSCSSQGSGPDDIESLGDVYVWGEVWCDTTDGSSNPYPTKTDVLVPRSLESNVVLDVQQIACGVRHFALVTRQGEVFTWGEESGGRLGHGVEKDFSRPRLVEFLAVSNIEFVACGEYHTCAVSASGDLYSWGGGANNTGLLGHGTDVSHWIPKRVSGPLEGVQVLSVACGTWHTALVTSSGRLFTFGDGTFGVLGHGNRESVPYPKEVHALDGLKTIKVACGVWHTAAIIEVTNHTASSVPSRKLFTWGDGDKHRLGHGNKEAYLLPTCVSALVDYNFNQLALGHFITIALTTSGHVFTMGSSAYGQLGNPQSDGKLPCLVQDRLVGEFVEEIACGSYHVAVLTSRSEVFTWGRGANGRLGHGDVEDRKTPTLVESLKDRHVKSISCGSNYTASICIHKWVSGTDQSVCSGCRQAFGFTRKRHNCYNCGLVHCHACSSKKALKAALAPTPGKPHRVCDSCYNKLKSSPSSNPYFNRRTTAIHHPTDSSVRFDRGDVRTSRLLLSPTVEPVKYLEVKTSGGAKSDSYSIVRASQVPSLLQLKDIAFPSSLSALQYAFKPTTSTPPTPHPRPQPQPPPQPRPQPQTQASTSRPPSPVARRPSPPRSTTPGYPKGVQDSLKKTNDLLSQEVMKLHNQIKSLKKKAEDQDVEIQKLQEFAQEATFLAAQETSRCSFAKEVINCVANQLKEITEKLPPELSSSESFKEMQSQVGAFLNANGASGSGSGSRPSLPAAGSVPAQNSSRQDTAASSTVNDSSAEHRHQRSSSHLDIAGGNLLQNGEDTPRASSRDSSSSLQRSNSGSSSSTSSSSRSEGQKEVIEQFEPGVYVTLIQFPNGTKVFKRVRFSKRRFAEQQAEEWWKANKDRLLRKYTLHVSNGTANGPSSTTPAPAPPSEESSNGPTTTTPSS